MNSTPSLSALAPVLLASLALAQGSAVIPAGYASVEGNLLTDEPFSYDQVSHVQYVHQSLLTAVPSNAVLTSLAYRRDQGFMLDAVLRRARGTQGTTPVWEIRLRNYTGSVLQPDAAMPISQPTLWTAAMTARIVSFPDLPRSTNPTANFDVVLMFDRPFAYTGTSLGIHHFSYETNNVVYPTYLMDSVFTQPSIGSVALISPTSTGCPANENRCNGTAPNPGGGNLEVYLYDGKPNSAGACYLGTSSTSWNGFGLPMGLGFLGLPACSVYTDLTVAFPRAINSAGISSLSASVPGDPSLVSATIYSQWATLDDRVNPAFPVATSDGLALTFGPVLHGYAINMSTVSLAGNLARGQRGIVRPGEGLIFRLSWQ
jgi:hypothetical protein